MITGENYRANSNFNNPSTSNELYKSSFFQRNSFPRAILLLGLLLMCASPALAGESEVLAILSERHPNFSNQQLEDAAGGSDQLIAILLEQRTKEAPPFLGLRAEKILLSYSDREEVVSALESDVENPNFYGLARLIGMNLSSVTSESSKNRLTRAVLARSQREQRFSRFGKMLLSSDDTEVQRIARETLGE